jgi:class 3 adenylate cyclase/pimeloyl-ACP methyl ester carboxylesterase
MERPSTKYVSVGETDVAYQVIGDGPMDLLFCYGLGSHIELVWDAEPLVEIFRRLASFSRLIYFDRRGIGASDRVPDTVVPTWEQWAEDFHAVLDAVGSEKAAILAHGDVGPLAMLFAAMHPERVSALILFNTAARWMRDDDYPIGLTPADLDALLDIFARASGTPEFQALFAPSMANDPEYLALAAKITRSSATPRNITAQWNYILRYQDVRSALPLISAPTLVLHSRDNTWIDGSLSRFLAEHIEGAIFRELPGADVTPSPEWQAMSDAVAEFLGVDHPEPEIDRVLATILFTDIVGSTERAAVQGDAGWRVILDAHDRYVREQIRKHRGREINTTGDGFVISFDGPARAIRCAEAIGDAITRQGLQVRMGLHTGECEIRGEDLGGLAVHIAARVSGLANAGEILVSGTVKDLVVGSGIDFEDRGERELKGVPGSWRLFAVEA